MRRAARHAARHITTSDADHMWSVADRPASRDQLSDGSPLQPPGDPAFDPTMPRALARNVTSHCRDVTRDAVYLLNLPPCRRGYQR